MNSSEPHKLLRWSMLLLLIGAVASGVAVFHFARLYKQTAAALAGLQSESRQWRTSLEQLAQENDDLRRRLGMPPVHAADAERLEQERRQLEKANAARLEAARMLSKLEQSMNAASSKASSLEERNRELESVLESVRAELQRLIASEADLKERLAGANRIVEAMQTELKARTERATQLEIENATLREENRKLNEKNSQAVNLMRELEEIGQRRDALLNQIQRRYRDLTDQYRVMAARSDRDGPSSSASADLSRLQHTVSQAEEELRQLSALNAQALRLQQRLRGK